MSEQLVFKRSSGDLEVWAEDDGGLWFEWSQPTEHTSSYPMSLSLSADELTQVLALREKVRAAKRAAT